MPVDLGATGNWYRDELVVQFKRPGHLEGYSMSAVLIDDELRAKLSSREEHVPLIGSDGATVGYVISPEVHALVLREAYGRAHAATDEADLRAALADPTRYTTAQMLELVEGK